MLHKLTKLCLMLVKPGLSEEEADKRELGSTGRFPQVLGLAPFAPLRVAGLEVLPLRRLPQPFPAKTEVTAVAGDIWVFVASVSDLGALAP